MMKANEYLETEALDLKSHRKALLSIMEDAERFNAELKQEIAERQRAQAETARAKENMELILHGSDLGYWAWDIPNQTQTYNDRFAAILGYHPDQMDAQQEWRQEHIHPADLQTVDRNMARHLNGKTETYTSEHRMRRSSSNWIWVLDRGKVVEWDKDHTPLRMVGTLLDITERKQAEEEIRELQRYNRGLIEVNLDPLVTFDHKGVIMDVNGATIQATGRTREELIGTPFADYFTDPERAYKGAMLTFETGEVRDYELVMKARDGTETMVACNASVYMDQEGNVVGAFAAARDITERKAAEQELRETVKRLEEYTNRINSLVVTMLGELAVKQCKS